MEHYKCQLCNKFFKQKTDFLRHQKRKTPCFFSTPNCSDRLQMAPAVVTQNNEFGSGSSDIQNLFKCKFCDTLFKQHRNVLRHERERCKVKKQKDSDMLKNILDNIKDIKNTNKEIIEENKVLKTEIRELRTQIINNTKDKSIITNSNSNNNNNNTTNKINNNTFNLVAHGKENLNSLTTKEIIDIIDERFLSITTFVKALHFNENKPEFSNVFISNLRSNFGTVFDGLNWISRDKNKIIDDLYSSKYEFLEEKFDALINLLDNSTIKYFKNFLEHVNDKKLEANIKREILLLLYNNRYLPENIKKTMED